MHEGNTRREVRACGERVGEGSHEKSVSEFTGPPRNREEAIRIPKELKTRISQVLELLTRQIATQEKQFLELTETVRDLVKEKSRLQNALAEKQTETDVLQGEFERTKELLEAERFEHYRNVEEKVDRACQTEEQETTVVPEEFDRESIFCRPQNPRIKRRIDLEEASTEGTLLRELFFRKPSVEESGTLDIIPVLSESDQQTKRSSSILFT
ncbi:hypothetical protein ANTQUA_LOCUS10254 [Anthophora quadrimaculata]